MRESAGIFDLSAFAIFDIVGPGALASVQKVAMRQMDVTVGRVVYTPVLSETGGFKSDLTIMRLEKNVFRVVTGGAHGMADLKWFTDHLRGRRGARRPDDRLHDDRPLGPATPARSSSRSPAPTCRTRPSSSAPAGRSRSARS